MLIVNTRFNSIFFCDYSTLQTADGSLRNFLTRQGLRKESLPVFIRYPKLKCEYGKEKFVFFVASTML